MDITNIYCTISMIVTVHLPMSEGAIYGMKNRYERVATRVSLFHFFFLVGWTIYFFLGSLLFLHSNHSIALAGTLIGFFGILVLWFVSRMLFWGWCPLSLLEKNLRSFTPNSNNTSSFFQQLINGEFGLPKKRILWTIGLWGFAFLTSHTIVLADVLFIS